MKYGSKRTHRVLAASLGVLALGLASCSSTPEPTATPSPPPSPSSAQNATLVFDESIQQALADVGCYKGSIDGIMGSGTDAAILEFQKAKGLEATGELNEETDSELRTASEEGETVCGGSSASPSSSAGGKAPCTAAAIQAGLKSGEKVTSYVCADGGDERWAAGDDSTKDFDAVFIMKDVGGQWEQIDRDEICGTASAGVPESILAYCDVS